MQNAELEQVIKNADSAINREDFDKQDCFHKSRGLQKLKAAGGEGGRTSCMHWKSFCHDGDRAALGCHSPAIPVKING